MQRKVLAVRNGTLIFLLFGLSFDSGTRGNSIMDMINMERVQKLLAERRENASIEMDQDKLIIQNTVDGDDNNDDDDEGNPEETLDLTRYIKHKPWHRFGDRGMHSNSSKGHRPRQNFTGIPDVSSLLADFAGVRVDKLLKSQNSQVVTKTEYLRKGWCRTEPILQKLREDGCITRTILNRFCYGQCNSFYIPRNPPKRRKTPGQKRRKQGPPDEDSEENLVFKTCGFCKPKKTSWISVTLRCPSLVPPFRRKRIRRIRQCKCLSENVH